MCGIAGFVDFKAQSGVRELEEMIATLNHRGPDDRGYEVFHVEQGVIGLAQARLSIIDTSPAGHQPMHHQDLTIVFNGEIYNYRELREQLRTLGHTFSTGSDTEVILHAYQAWGNECVHRFIGMFVIVLFDRSRGVIRIFRDRCGVKPLYYSFHDGIFLFGSELKALVAHPRFDKTINHDVLPGYLDSGFIGAPHTIYQKAKKLNPASWLTIDIREASMQDEVRYWSINDFYSKPFAYDAISYEEARDEVIRLLRSAVEYRMVSDVPVGLFLSGGYDSSMVAALLQSQRTEQIQTFTIGFESPKDEAPFARRIAQHLGTSHHELYCSPREAQEIIPRLPFYFDEPFADSSAIPTILVSEFARKHVTVALSADGGDELFGGYVTYQNLLSKSEWLHSIPSPVRNLLGRSASLMSHLIPSSRPQWHHQFSGAALAMHPDSTVQAARLFLLMSSIPSRYKKALLGVAASPLRAQEQQAIRHATAIEWAMAHDFNHYMADDILVKVDRATMSTSLEGREPLLDHRLAEFVSRLPLSYKMGQGYSKRLLKDIAHQFIPSALLDRPKTGFSLPIFSWLKGDLAYLIDEYLTMEKFRESQLFVPEGATQIVKQFKAGTLHHTPIIWRLLMAQMWYYRWMK